MEVLAHFRKDARLSTELDEIAEDDEDKVLHPTLAPGQVPREWLEVRTAAYAELSGHYCAVTASGSVAAIHVLADSGVRDHGLMLVKQPVKNSLSGMALLPRSVQVCQQHRINEAFEWPQLRCLPGRNPARRWFRGGQRLPDRSPGDPVLPGKAADR
ncbi:hypothetical protein D7003_13570 [Arthrobacter oryzae]|uniref:Uncharacterized protein n=1 Tax=Arthrobacter oryzae TaxID=409290 RepID=A0A3N0BUM1_9MICC|nr:hypothetical protein D7003_13570 [Arthrobacter oryzae]